MSFDHPTIVELLATQWSEPDDGSNSWKVYGITAAVRAQIASLQDGRCSICGEERPLVIDHDHVTNRVRGLICGRCNTALGRAADEAARLRAKSARLLRSAAYLEHAATLPPARGDGTAWLARAASKRIALQAELPLPPAPHIEIDDVFGAWPPEQLQQPPSRRIVTAAEFVADRWAMWCPNDQVEREIEIGVGSNRSWNGLYVQSKGVATTASLLLMKCATPREAVAFYAVAFARTFRPDMRPWEAGDDDFSQLADWLSETSWTFLSDVPRAPWHHSSRTVLPDSDSVGYEDMQAVRTREDIVRLVAIHWADVMSRWTILDYATPSWVKEHGAAS